jgi:hypothetical protein
MGSADYGSAIGGLGNMITGIWGNNAAAQAENAAIGNASNTLNQYYGTAAGYQQPYSAAGQTGLGGAQNLANQAPLTSNFQYNYQQDPAYQAQLTGGNRNIQSQASSLGNLFSGSTMKALNAYGSNLANQSYAQNYARALQTYQDQRNFNANQLAQKYQQYMGLAGIGQSAANNLTGLSTQQGNSQAGLNIAQGNANAGAIMGEANAIGNGIGQMFGSSGSSGGGGGGGFNLGSLFGGGNSGTGDNANGTGGLQAGNYSLDTSSMPSE